MAKFEVGVPVKTDTPTVEVTVSANAPLAPGKYRFQLQVIDNDGLKSALATRVVTIEKSGITVPDLIGLRPDEARKIVAELNLQLALSGTEIHPDGAGRIVSQDPPPGQQVDAGSKVSVVLAVAEVLIGTAGPRPDTLYWPATCMLSASHILQAITDGPFDERGYAYQPVIFSEVSAPDVRRVSVKRGAPMVSNGRITRALLQTFAMQMSLTAQLRPDLVWEDGQPVTAHDLKFAFDIVSNPDTPYSKFRTKRTAVYEAVDDLTIRWIGLPGWTDANAMLNLLPPLPQHLIGNIPPKELPSSEFAVRPISYGPYIIDRVDSSGSEIRLIRHPRYFRADEGLPRFNEMALIFTEESDHAFELLAANDIDIALSGSLGFDRFDKLRDMERSGEFDLQIVQGHAQEYLFFNYASQRMERFIHDRLVRQAIAFAIDQDFIIDQILHGNGRRITNFIAPDHPFFLSDLEEYRFDPDRAKELVAEAGFPDGLGEARLFVPSGRADRLQIAEAIAEMLVQIGLGVEILAVAPQKLFAKGARTPLFGRTFDMALFSWAAGVAPPADLFLCEEIPDRTNGFGAPNFSGYCSEEFDTLALDAMTSTPVNARAMWEKPQRFWNEDLPAVPLYAASKLMVMRSSISDMMLDRSQPSEMADAETVAK